VLFCWETRNGMIGGIPLLHFVLMKHDNMDGNTTLIFDWMGVSSLD